MSQCSKLSDLRRGHHGSPGIAGKSDRHVGNLETRCLQWVPKVEGSLTGLTPQPVQFTLTLGKIVSNLNKL